MNADDQLAAPLAGRALGGPESSFVVAEWQYPRRLG